jgi:hypothetical protein
MNHLSDEDLTNDEKEFGIWLINGIERGWISEPYCHTHDGGMQYMSEEEMKEWDEGGDPCENVIRIFIS